MPQEPIASPRVVAWRTRRLVAIMLAAGLVLLGLTLLAEQSGPTAVDLTATLWLQSFTATWFASLMYVVSWPGFPPQSWVIPVVVAVPFVVRSMWMEAVWLLGTQVASLVDVVLKQIVHRPRPSHDLVGVLAPLTDPSFPSGHVVQYTAVFGFAFFLVYVLAKRSALRTLVLTLLAVPVVLVGPSRLYLGQHWLSDVLGGYALAVLYLVPYCWAYVKWRLEHAQEHWRTRKTSLRAVGAELFPH
ncbi:MAG: phosphatase PAP2 family protein [Chloroflexota bacterium]|nr:phosphatase PAP2 family protein [Chloroflexota bacterium]